MKLEQIQRHLEKSEKYSGRIKMKDNLLEITSEFLLGMPTYPLNSTISLKDEYTCIIKHPITFYERPEQAGLFLKFCYAATQKQHNIEFEDDANSQCIVAINKQKISALGQLFLGDLIETTVSEHVNEVKRIRYNIGTQIRNTVTPLIGAISKRTIFYLSLMQYHEENFQPISVEWIDTHQFLNMDGKIALIPDLNSHTPNKLLEEIPEYIKLYGKENISAIIMEMSEPISADTCEGLCFGDIPKQIQHTFQCPVLYGKDYGNWYDPFQIEIAIVHNNSY